MPKNVLVTGGAGFIGSHLVDALVEKGHNVRILDNLDPQVHGQDRLLPDYLNAEAEFICGDVRDRDVLEQALERVEVVFHHAAAVGIGQSMYQIRRYIDVNTLGTATLLDVLANGRHRTEKLLIASSMSVYGEGKYSCEECGVVFPILRSSAQLSAREWAMKCPSCGCTVRSLPTDEGKPLKPTSTYAVSKRDQEELCLCIGRAYGIPTVALRYFNVYGPRQSLSNPYTGVVAIFASRVLNGMPPIIYEDGQQSRDFVHVSDIVQANLLAMESEKANYQVFNVGTGRPVTIVHIAEMLCEMLNSCVSPQITGQYRAGDIRHCYADVSKIEDVAGSAPKVQFADGIMGLLDWFREQQPTDHFRMAEEELETRGLTR